MKEIKVVLIFVILTMFFGLANAQTANECPVSTAWLSTGQLFSISGHEIRVAGGQSKSYCDLLYDGSKITLKYQETKTLDKLSVTLLDVTSRSTTSSIIACQLQFIPCECSDLCSACTEEYKPVCGMPPMPTCPDGALCKIAPPVPTTYSNKCKLDKAQAKYLYDGECKKLPVCGNGVCEEGEDTFCPVADCLPGQVCPMVACRVGSCPSDCVKPNSCTDSDGGINYEQVGSVTEASGQSLTDYCINPALNEGKLNEYYCSNNMIAVSEYKCPNGCKDGVCIKDAPAQFCKDSDSGSDYFVKGFVSTNFNGQNPSNLIYDSCLIPDPNYPNQETGTYSCSGANCRVVDYICEGVAGAYGTFMACPNGCKDGACIKEVPQCSQAGQSCGGIRGQMCCGDLTCKYIDDPRAGMTADASGVCVKPTACTDEYKPVCGQPPIPVCKPGTVCPQVMPPPRTYSNNCVMKNAGATLLYEGECKPKVSCIDSDGGIDYNVKGSETYGNFVYTDYCQLKLPYSPRDETNKVLSCNNEEGCYLVENYCDGEIGNWVGYKCPNGCSDGACLQKECSVTKIYFKEVQNRVYSYMYIEASDLPDYTLFGITGAGSWNNLIFKVVSGTSSRKTLRSTQTLNAAAVKYITQRLANIKLTNKGKVICEQINACTDEYLPVCGQPPMPVCKPGVVCPQVMPPQRTYSNKCMMEAAGATLLYEGECSSKCAKEGEYTSGPVSPNFQYGCCAGLSEYATKPGMAGSGALCYDSTKGTPVCKNDNTRSEGWYYSISGELLKYEECTATNACSNEGEMCGGIQGKICCTDLKCNMPDGNGGGADLSGTCVKQAACTKEYKPVCGLPKFKCAQGQACSPPPQTYANRCMMENAGAKFLYEGECKNQRPVCGNGVCEEGEDTFCPVADCQPGQRCPRMPCREGSCPKDCVKGNSCTDTDGGNNYQVKGDVTYCTFGSEEPGAEQTKLCALHSDVCVNDASLSEYSCRGNDLVNLQYRCPEGCSNGACLGITTGKFKIAGIEGSKPEYNSNEKITLKIKAIEPDGSPAESSEGFNVQFSIQSTSNDKTFSGGNGRFENKYWYVDLTMPADNGKYNQIIYLYCSRDDATCAKRYGQAAQVEDWSVVTVSGSVFYCNDTDNGDINVKGQMQTNEPNWIAGDKIDYCVISKDNGQSGSSVPECSGEECYVEEYLCISPTQPSAGLYKCPNGCKDGACVGECKSNDDCSRTTPTCVGGRCACSWPNGCCETYKDCPSSAPYCVQSAAKEGPSLGGGVCDPGYDGHYCDKLAGNEDCRPGFTCNTNCNDYNELSWCSPMYTGGTQTLPGDKIRCATCSAVDDICTSTKVCYDTDGGVTPEKYGVVNGLNANGEATSIPDRCGKIINDAQEIFTSYCGPEENCKLYEGVCFSDPYDNNEFQVVGVNDIDCPNGCSNGACIQTDVGKIKITVIDKNSGTELRHAEVSIMDEKGNKFGTQSTSGGAAVFALSPGKYFALGHADGYNDGGQEFELRAGAADYLTVPLQFSMSLGFQNSYWQCYDGTSSFEGGATSCKSSSTWSEYAQQFCEGHCANEKCGVNSFSVSNECQLDAVCGDVQSGAVCGGEFYGNYCTYLPDGRSYAVKRFCADANSCSIAQNEELCEFGCINGICNPMPNCGDFVCYSSEFSSCSIDCSERKYPLELDMVYYLKPNQNIVARVIGWAIQDVSSIYGDIVFLVKNNGNDKIDLDQYAAAFYPSEKSYNYPFSYRPLYGNGVLLPGESKKLVIPATSSLVNKCGQDFRLGVAAYEVDQTQSRLGEFISIISTNLKCVSSGELFFISEIRGLLSQYTANQEISLNVVGMEPDGSFGTYDEGFDLSYTVKRISGDGYQVLGGGASFSENMWYISFRAPTPGDYEFAIDYYCRSEDTQCALKYGKVIEQKRVYFTVEGQRCYDSDGGKDYNTRGKADGLYGPSKEVGVIWGQDANRCSAVFDANLGTSIHYDCCSDSSLNKQLNEAYCDQNGIMMSEGYQCPYGCSEGKCNSKPMDNAVKIERPGNRFNLGDTLSGVWVNMLTESDLPMLLASGMFSDKKGENIGETKYRQNLNLQDTGVFTIETPEDEHINFYQRYYFGKSVYIYNLEFDMPIDISSNAKDDLAGNNLIIQGRKFTIINAALDSNGELDKLTLMNSDNSVWLSQDQPFSVGDHTVTVVDVDETATKCGIEVDGVVNWVEKYDTDDISGLSVGVLDVKLVASPNNDQDSCNLVIGTHILEFEDHNEVSIDDYQIRGTEAYLVSKLGKWSGLQLNYMMESEADEFKEMQQSLVDPVFGQWEILFDKVNYEPVEEVQFESNGADARLTFTNGDMKQVEIDWTYADGKIMLGTAADEPMLMPGSGYSGDLEGVKLFYTSNVPVVHLLEIRNLNCNDDASISIFDLTYGNIVADNQPITCDNSEQDISLGSVGSIKLNIGNDQIFYSGSLNNPMTQYGGGFGFYNYGFWFIETNGDEMPLNMIWVNLTWDDTDNEITIDSISNRERPFIWYEAEDGDDSSLFAYTQRGSIVNHKTGLSDRLGIIHLKHDMYADIYLKWLGDTIPSKLLQREPMLGSKEAPVQMIMYGDFQDPFSGRFYSNTLSQLKQEYIDTGKVIFVFTNFPLSFHPEAYPAALASECAQEQGKFWEFYSKLFENQGELSQSNYILWASQVNMDTDMFRQCMDFGRFKDEVDDDFNLGQKMGVSGTPTFFINGEKVDGAQPYENFKGIIDNYLGLGTCKDSDGGVNYYIKGNAIDPKFPQGLSDFCFDYDGNHPNNLVEYKCGYFSGWTDGTPDGYYATNEYYDCVKGCYDGACIKDANQYDLSSYPAPFYESDALNVWIVVGENAPTSDVLAAVDIAAGFTGNRNQNQVGTNAIDTQVAVLDTEILEQVTDNQPLMKNLIVVGPPCYNKISEILMGSPEICYQGLEDGKGRLKLFSLKGKLALLVDGYNYQDTKSAATVLAKYKEYDLNGDECEVVTADTPILNCVGSQLLPERCQFSAGLDCIDKANICTDTSTVTFVLRNNIGFAIDVNSASGQWCDGAKIAVEGDSSYGDFPKRAENNQLIKIQLTGCNPSEFEAQTITLSYTNIESGLIHSVLGEIRGVGIQCQKTESDTLTTSGSSSGSGHSRGSKSNSGSSSGSLTGSGSLGDSSCSSAGKKCGGEEGYNCCSDLSCVKNNNDDSGYGTCVSDLNEMEETMTPMQTSEENIAPIFVSAESDCNGCLNENWCLPFGTRLVKSEGERVYCDTNGEFKDQKVLEQECSNNYECISNACFSGTCEDLVRELRETNSLLQKVLEMINNLI